MCQACFVLVLGNLLMQSVFAATASVPYTAAKDLWDGEGKAHLSTFYGIGTVYIYPELFYIICISTGAFEQVRLL